MKNSGWQKWLKLDISTLQGAQLAFGLFLHAHVSTHTHTRENKKQKMKNSGRQTWLKLDISTFQGARLAFGLFLQINDFIHGKLITSSNDL